MAETPNSGSNQATQEERLGEAKNFIKKVQQRLQPADFKAFMDMMICFKYQRFSRAAVAETAQKLFKGDQELIARMNSYLPEKYKIAIPDPHQAAVSFLMRVKTTYQHDNGTTYGLLMGILKTLKAGNTTIGETIKEVKELLKDSPHLLLEFETFCPGHHADE